MSGITLMHGGCLERMAEIEPGSVDMVLADLPYGTTQNKWDSVIPFDKLWPALERVAKPSAAIVLTASQPFTSLLIASRLKLFRYTWVWHKSRPTGHMNAKKQPLREHEDICVFYDKQPTYSPQFTKGSANHVGSVPRVKTVSGNYGAQYEIVEKISNQKYPKSILPFLVNSPTHSVHPTQKPVALMEYLIRTYSNPGELVLDCTMGSGTTGVAAVNMGRCFVGVELEAKYFEIAQRRIDAATAQAGLFAEDGAHV